MMLLSVSQLFFGFAFASSISDSGWPLQTFVTEPNINPPVFDINKTGTTADGYIFMDTNTNGAASSDLVATIITDEGEIVWSAGYSDTTNPSLQTWNDQDVILYVSKIPCYPLEFLDLVSMQQSHTDNVPLVGWCVGR